MKTVLCFGDSNTWGYVPGSDWGRFPADVRWPGVMRRQLGEGFQVIEEGLNGRTTVWDDPCMAFRNGREHLPVLLDTHTPLDLVIIMLGTNDLKHYLGLTAHDIALGAATLVEMVQQSTAGRLVTDVARSAPPVLLVAPPRVVETPTPFGHKFDDAVARSAGLGEAYREIADQLQCGFFDAGTVCTCPDTDGVHMDAEAHQQLGAAMTSRVLELLDVVRF